MKKHGSFFAWMGGKFKAAPKLARLLPDHNCYVEVFAGAANLLFTKDKSKTEVINDVNAELVNLFRVVKYHKREFLLQIADILHSRQCFLEYKDQPGLTDIQRAARTWFVMKTAFGGKGEFTLADHADLARLLKSIKGKFMLTINDHKDIRRLYQGLPTLKVRVDYTVGGSNRKTAGELVIANYPLPRRW